MNFSDIPVFDLQLLNSKDEVQKLQSTLHNIGFFYIKNHGVDLDLIKEIYNQSKKFFDLSLDQKMETSILKSKNFRGYSMLEEEMTEGKPDYKETFDLGLEQNERDLKDGPDYFKLQGPNQWPRSLESQFKPVILEYLNQMQLLGDKLLQIMAQTLNLPKDTLSQYFSSQALDAYSMLRLIKYPPGSANQFGVGPHIDSGCLVILLQDMVGGLQVQNVKGQWIDATPIPDTFVVNVGKTLELWSDSYFVATPHRVLNSSSSIRYSIPFFLEPNLSTVVKPLKLDQSFLKSRKTDNRENESIVYGELMVKVFQRSYPKVGRQTEE